ncbi:hypothetical protein Pan189_36040 [Stratiformator vulcanicus]|uniref:Uncharacterized protein n=1 Tax=Stratiformator vulcanicus TaxID=2527980 RepID=A0A517R5P2_9PLAN|nr:hypothetical protein Pan189_36040 [Stratiformator vulcanicus]
MRLGVVLWMLLRDRSYKMIGGTGGRQPLFRVIIISNEGDPQAERICHFRTVGNAKLALPFPYAECRFPVLTVRFRGGFRNLFPINNLSQFTATGTALASPCGDSTRAATL